MNEQEYNFFKLLHSKKVYEIVKSLSNEDLGGLFREIFKYLNKESNIEISKHLKCYFNQLVKIIETQE